MKLTKDGFDHPCLMPIRQPRAATRVQTDRNLCPECCCDRRKRFQARMGIPGFDTTVERSVDTRGACNLGFRGSGVRSQSQQVVADLAFESTETGLDLALHEAFARLVALHRVMEPRGAQPAVIARRARCASQTANGPRTWSWVVSWTLGCASQARMSLRGAPLLSFEHRLQSERHTLAWAGQVGEGGPRRPQTCAVSPSLSGRAGRSGGRGCRR